jgi:hypothetical protein
VSGYEVPLAKEVQTTPTIVIGTVVKERGIKADPEDPEGFTHFVYMVRVSEVLKGSAPSLIALFTGNHSGGYRMTVGETHLLFLKRRGNLYHADLCGNSGVLGKFGASPSQVKSVMGEGHHVP